MASNFIRVNGVQLTPQEYAAIESIKSALKIQTNSQAVGVALLTLGKIIEAQKSFGDGLALAFVTADSPNISARVYVPGLGKSD